MDIGIFALEFISRAFLFSKRSPSSRTHPKEALSRNCPGLFVVWRNL
jgi:hypothetical protein